MKEFLISDTAGFKLRAKMSACLAPKDLYCVEFIGEQYNDKGEMINDSTYQFFLTPDHLKTISTEFERLAHEV